MFGPSKVDMWSQLSEQIGGDFEKGGFLRKDKVTLTHRQWQITLDTYTVSTGHSAVVYTRLRAPFVNPDGFRFNIHRKHVFSWLPKMFGQQDIEIGEPEFDEAFVIQGTSETNVKALLANTEIRRLIDRQPKINFQVKDDEGWFGSKFPEGVDELYFQVGGIIKDKAQLKDLFDLFALVLDELCRMGTAYDAKADVTLK